ncbi:MAG: rubrerythrin family protein [Candidatus Lokiarchaeota archaeon]|nr:rubrerythrin family protein [Candidatus Lokiarchaeota archaeon]
MSLVIDNLKEAIIGESIAKRKYELFSENAIKENQNEIAHIFRAVSSAEEIHIKNHLKALSIISKISIEQIKTELLEDIHYDINKNNNTISNLEDAIKGENYESKVMYKNFEKNALNNKNNLAELSFSLARKAEKIHAKIFSNYLRELKKNRPINAKKIYICKICGNVEFGNPPAKCPICDHSSKFFKEIM